MELRLDATQLAGFADLWKRAPEIMAEEILVSITEADLLLMGELQRELPKAVGGQQGAGLVGSIFTDEQKLSDNVIGTVASGMSYAVYVEIGTGPRDVPPPMQPILDWVRVKLGLNDEEAESAAFAIRRKIQREGTRPQPVWARTVQAKNMEVLVKLAQGVERVLNRLAPGAAA